MFLQIGTQKFLEKLKFTVENHIASDAFKDEYKIYSDGVENELRKKKEFLQQIIEKRLS